MRAESAEDAERCRSFGSSIGVPIETERVKVEPATEAEARRVRYKALDKIASRVDADKIATGHTLDDNVETILMRLSRGGRVWGIPHKRERIVRPLLDLRRADTEAECHSEGVGFLSDPSNFDERFTRNRIRARVMPQLSESEVGSLLAMAAANRQEAANIEEEVLVAEARGDLVFEPDGALLSRRWLSAASPEARRAALRRATEPLGSEVSERLVTDLERKLLRKTGTGLDLPRGWMAWAETNQIVMGRPQTRNPLPEILLNVPGATISTEWGIEVRTFLEPASAMGILEGPPGEAVLDADATGRSLRLRQWRPGDRFWPLGAPGTKKLQDFFVDSKVPRRNRDRIPIVVSGERIVWVAGGRIDERFKLTAGSRHGLRIQIFPILQEGGTPHSITVSRSG